MDSCSAPIMEEDAFLDSWIKIGSGGFGQIYKARHKNLCCDFAIKLLHRDDGSDLPLLRELDMMRLGSSPYVIQVLGVFRGLSPCGPGTRLGLVMPFMERGCVTTLQERLNGAPPWPLVFRLAHQVTLGINFLHNLSPPLLHLDLKPSNVLLDDYINAKLTDFGLAKVYHSVSRASDSASEEGTLSYMPPEALEDLSYTPTKASDIYSFGILLWSIITGKQPYPHAMSSMIRIRIPLGDRPSLKQVQDQAAEVPGLTRLQALMERCWGTEPSERPSSYNCTLVTEELYALHKHSINSAVLQVLEILDQSPTEKPTRLHITPTVNAGRSYIDPPTGKGPVQEVAGYSGDKEQKQSGQFSDPVSETEITSPPSPKLKPSSVKPIQGSLPPSSSSSSSSSPKHSTNSNRTTQPAPATRTNKFQEYQRHLSNPGSSSSSPRLHKSPAPHVNIVCSYVSGVQIGDNNTMNIERRRHPTAPSRVNLQPQRKGSGKDKKGGDG